MSQVAVALHAPAVTHVRCEHGQLVELPVERASAPGADLSVARTPHDGHETTHEHCPLSTVMRQASLAAGAAATVAVSILAALEPSLPEPPSSRACRLAIYRVAPKTSPPA